MIQKLLQRLKMTGKKFILIIITCLFFSAPVVSQTDEETVGLAGVAQILGVANLHNSEAAQSYVNLLGSSLASRSGASYKWVFGVIQSESINAFAFPGGYVVVTSGLIKQLKSEDELAFVLAHEIAHISKKHYYNVVRKQRLTEQASKNLQVATNSSDNAQLSTLSAQIYARGLDKASEFEADRLGVEIMSNTGYDPAAALSVLDKIQNLKSDDSRSALLFSTHPSVSERFDSLIKSGIDQLPIATPATNKITTNRFQKFIANF